MTSPSSDRCLRLPILKHNEDEVAKQMRRKRQAGLAGARPLILKQQARDLPVKQHFVVVRHRTRSPTRPAPALRWRVIQPLTNYITGTNTLLRSIQKPFSSMCRLG